jgi:hypothetical protein
VSVIHRSLAILRGEGQKKPQKGWKQLPLATAIRDSEVEQGMFLFVICQELLSAVL